MSSAAFTERAVQLTTCFNVRDMGGWRTEDGRTVRWGRLYRGDTLHRLDVDEFEVLAGLGLRTVVDLRSDQELEEHGRFRHGSETLRHHHMPFIDEVGPSASRPVEAPRSLADGYVGMAIGARTAIARAVGVIAAPGALPAVFHCTAGKDRTGILAAVILSAIGVVDDDVVADYELTAETREARQEWLAVHDPAYLAYLETLPPEALEVRGDAVQAVLDRLRSDYGSIASYLAGGGLDLEALDSLAAALLEA